MFSSKAQLIPAKVDHPPVVHGPNPDDAVRHGRHGREHGDLHSIKGPGVVVLASHLLGPKIVFTTTLKLVKLGNVKTCLCWTGFICTNPLVAASTCVQASLEAITHRPSRVTVCLMKQGKEKSAKVATVCWLMRQNVQRCADEKPEDERGNMS